MTEIDRDRRAALFEAMLLMRRFEEAVAQLSKEHPFGHFHLYIGQEATGAGALAALRADDLTLTTHRNHGHIVGRGADPARALAEILGRAHGLNRGYGGTLHLTDRARGFLATSAVVGGVVGLATGAAHALKRAGRGAVSVAFFGDAALEEGIAFEAMNMAALWRLPVLYLCENNSRGAPGAKAGEYPSSEMAAAELVHVPRALGIATDVVNGADPEAVYAAVALALGRLRKGEGPAFVEARTQRWPGSRPIWPELATGVLDLALAWEPERIAGPHAAWIRQHDPILRYARALTDRGDFETAELCAIDARVGERIAAAKAEAVASPWPEADAALAGAFA